MDDHKILQHLLNLENEAAALVNDAQAEADRRVVEGETQNRARHDEVYAKEVEVLELAYAQNLASIKENYSRQLEDYRETLINVSLDAAAFSSLAEKQLFKSILSDKDS